MTESPGFLMQLGTAFRSYYEAVRFLFRHELWVYLLYPLILLILLFIGGFEFAGQYIDEIRSWLLGFIDSGSDSQWTHLFSGFLYVLLTIVLKILLFFIISSISKFLVLFLMSPVMSVLSEKTERILTGRKEPFTLAAYLRNTARGMGIALRNILIQILIIAGCVLLAWIPFAGWLSPFVLGVTSWYFYGFSMIDYHNERQKMSIAESVKHVKAHKTTAIVNGFVFSLIFDIPVLGIIFAPVLAPVAACIAMTGLQKK